MEFTNWERILLKAGCSTAVAKQWAPAFKQWCRHYDIWTSQRISAFLANIMIESMYLKVVTENLNYSAQGLANTWPSRYASGGKPNATALRIARNPEAIANNCYANRMGNGNEASGDGWRYRGRGPLQITGFDNYKQYKNETGVDVVKNPDLLLEADNGSRAACIFWQKNNINAYADKGDFDGCADKVNIGRKTAKVGDAHGYTNRKAIYDRLLTFMKANPRILEEEAPVVAVDPLADIPLEVNWNERYDPLGEFTVVKEYKKL